MATRDDYRVLQNSMYFEVLELEDTKTEEELKNKVATLKAKLASSMTESEVAWVEKKHNDKSK